MQALSNHIKIDSPPQWLPPELRGKGKIVHTFRFTKGERQVFKKRKKIRPSVHAERHRVVSGKMSALPGPWRNRITPHLVGIMDASFHDSVEMVIVCKTPQSGVTEAIFNCIGYAIDRDPGPAMCVYNAKDIAEENFRDRLIPMIQSSRRLRSYLTGYDDDISQHRINLKHMIVHAGWATSLASSSNKPARYLSLDEVDKYAVSLKNETASWLLFEARTTTFRWNRKIWKFSTPSIESGPIWQALTHEAQVIFDYWVVCPKCGWWQLMTFSKETFKWPEDVRDLEQIRSKNLAWYECPHCHERWNDTLRDQACRAGQWRSRPTEEQKKVGEKPIELFEYLDRFMPKKIGFFAPSWISYFVSLSQIAAAFMKGQQDLKRGYYEAFKDFKNKYEALPWKQIVTSSTEEKILKARCDVKPQTVPDDAIILTFGADVQKHGFWFAVRAWAAVMTSWLIHYGFVATWEDIENILYNTAYPITGSDRSMRIMRACIDTGGGSKYENTTMTEETYFWLIKNRGRGGVALWGTKGASNPLPCMLRLGEGLTSTPNGKKLPGGLRIISVDTQKAKDQFHYRLGLAAEGLPGGAYLHSETGADYAAQINAEVKEIDPKGREVWTNPHGRPNHLLDADLLSCACAEMEFPGGGIRLIAEAMKRRETERAQAPKIQDHDDLPNETWLSSGKFNRPRWFKRR